MKHCLLWLCLALAAFPAHAQSDAEMEAPEAAAPLDPSLIEPAKPGRWVHPPDERPERAPGINVPHYLLQGNADWGEVQAWARAQFEQECVRGRGNLHTREELSIPGRSEFYLIANPCPQGNNPAWLLFAHTRLGYRFLDTLAAAQFRFLRVGAAGRVFLVLEIAAGGGETIYALDEVRSLGVPALRRVRQVTLFCCSPRPIERAAAERRAWEFSLLFNPKRSVSATMLHQIFENR